MTQQTRRSSDVTPRFAAWLTEPIRDHAPVYVRVALAAVAINLIGLVTSLFSMTVYDRVVPNNAMSSLVVLTIGVAVVLVFDFVLKLLRAHFVDVAGARIDHRIGADVFEKLMAIRLDNRRMSTGALSGLVRELEALREFFASATLVAVVDVPFVLVALLVMWLVGGAMVLVPAIIGVVVIVIALATQPVMRRLSHGALRDSLSKQSVLIEAITGLETLRASNATGFMARRWGRVTTDHAASGLRQRFIAAFATTAATTAQTVAYIGVVVAGAAMVGEHRITTGAIVACSILSGRALAPLAQIAQLLTRLHATNTAYVQIDRLMQARTDEGHTRFSAGPIAGRLELRNVRFVYPGAETPAVDGITLAIEAGQRVALVGTMGSGKSTVARLLAGLVVPTGGQVLLDGLDLRSYDPAGLRKDMGVVLQDNMLLSGSVAENIALGRAGIDDAEVLRAATVSGTQQFMRQVPNGYDLRLADRGEGLSGGQRQSIAIARALAGRPRIVILDEPSSAMDMQSEQALLERLIAELEGRTVILVTHRPHLLSLVDRVVRIEHGRITADSAVDARNRARTERAAAVPTAAPATANITKVA